MKQEEAEENTSARPQEENASSETSSSLGGMPDLEPGSAAAPAAPASQHSKDEERTPRKRKRKDTNFIRVKRGIIYSAKNPLVSCLAVMEKGSPMKAM